MPSDDFRPVYHPAGHDAELRSVVQELRAGRWLAMRNLLEATPSWSAWTRRTQVLAAVAAGTDTVRAWRAEEPHSAAATAMHARVAVERAARAHREDHPQTRVWWHEAWEACRVYAEQAPDDPVPWVGLLALAPLDREQRMPEHRLPPPGPMLFPGPWALLEQVAKRDPDNREAHQRMLQFVYARSPHGALPEAVNYARWAVSSAPLGSPAHVLPLYVRAERYRRERGQDRALDLHWVTDEALRDGRAALHDWFDFADPADSSLLDLSHLAHALWGAHEFAEAARVFRTLDPYYAPVPWTYRIRDDHGDTAQGAVELYLRARSRSLEASGAP
ncbi:hypothetical protein GCM10010329_43110 [Streptomyces spiroverticillatus]|uniref:DUF4034 domain-containing protein n=1 Tax=Streptomyces finlayi TaxID=67296 RepID=A0A918WZ09_9ACTN|nr:hypothetical protein [Streptomyces finlayi]GHA15498.1 hypothetical protein GCM10010329_43110 [Streptomyces spiroverticillatus]GHC96710.1 hypothetical protein GCM10010334_37130 [Streptomyces finlayi]